MFAYVLYFFATVFASAVQNTVGFGSALIILGLTSIWFPHQQIEWAVVPMNVLLCALNWRSEHKSVHWRFLLRHVLAWSLLGIFLGYQIASRTTNEILLRYLFAGSLMFIGFVPQRLWVKWIPTHLLLLLAGVTHTLFATGGPMVAAATGKALKDPHAIRSSISVFLFFLNVSFLFFLKGRPDYLLIFLCFLGMAVSFPIGLKLRQMLSAPEKFKIWVYWLIGFLGVLQWVQL